MMLQSRSTLDVQRGFWQGINAQNVHEVFSAEEARQPEMDSLVDYTDLFQNFELARKDIRPYAKKLKHHISLTKAPDAAENHHGSSSINSQPRSQAGTSAQEQVDLSLLKSHLYLDPDTTKGVAELKTWLLGKLADSQEDDSLHQWCQHWEGRIDAVQNFEEQVIVRSLFVQSLRRLESFGLISTPAARSYMLLDIDEAELHPKRVFAEEEMGEYKRTLEHLPRYQQCQEVNNMLLVNGGEQKSKKKIIDELLVQQAHLFIQVFKATAFYHADWHSVMSLEAQRTQVVLDSFQDKYTPENNTPWSRSKAKIWDEKTIKILKLTRWQLRALAAPGAFRILTDWQARVFRQKFCPNPSQPTDKNTANSIDLSSIDLSTYNVMNIVDDEVFSVKEHRSLHKLFGKMCKPSWPLNSIKPYVFTQGPTEQVMPELAQPSANPMSVQASPSPTAVVHEVAQDIIAPQTARADRNTTPQAAQAEGVVFAPTATLAGGQLSRSSIADMFKGKKSSKKRPASPDRRPSKAIKLDFTLEKLSKTQQLIRDEMQAELRTIHEQLKGLENCCQDGIKATENEAVVKLDSLRQAIEGTVTTEQHAKLLSQVQQVQSQVNGISVIINIQSQMLQNMV
ncbi:hypothetical protein F4860DRAFT_483378 [Xylaria cubensis]|nr:hypothetical protein F4860DRAFT_483378 [Xylaria cubensis]